KKGILDIPEEFIIAQTQEEIDKKKENLNLTDKEEKRLRYLQKKLNMKPRVITYISHIKSTII
ncbi:MAG: hypothetical protein Q9M28_07960, partial [Mariprofundaceae bacterium]|nr:hypothetical protein [Mariprofundaceae bacterium]